MNNAKHNARRRKAVLASLASHAARKDDHFSPKTILRGRQHTESMFEARRSKQNPRTVTATGVAAKSKPSKAKSAPNMGKNGTQVANLDLARTDRMLILARILAVTLRRVFEPFRAQSVALKSAKKGSF